MRDQHRPKQDLINEVTALRKQVADLEVAMTERRRVEDALRRSEELLRAPGRPLPPPARRDAHGDQSALRPSPGL